MTTFFSNKVKSKSSLRLTNKRKELSSKYVLSNVFPWLTNISQYLIILKWNAIRIISKDVTFCHSEKF